MKILHTVEAYYPSVAGMPEVVRQLSERLAALGHKVTVATSKDKNRRGSELNKVSIKEFDLGGNAVLGFNGTEDEQKRYQDFLQYGQFDVIVNFAAQQWATDLALLILEKIKAKKVFVPTGFSGLYDIRYKDYFDNMKSWLKRYDLNIFLSNDYRDINFARDNGIEKIIIIPNGASEEEFLAPLNFDIRRELGVSPDNFLILLVGSHTGLKGHAEAIRIFSRAKIDKATLLIVGNFPGGWKRGRLCLVSCKIKEKFYPWLFKIKNQNKKLIIASLPREKTVAAYRSANLFLFPSNIECSPIVLFEAMAAKLPFLASAAGNTEEIISWSGGGQLLPSRKKDNGYCDVIIDESARLLEKTYSDKDLSQKLANSGFIAWQERFTWKKIARQYESEYKKLLNSQL